MLVNEYIVQVANDKLGGDLSRFDELWESVPNFGQKLRTFDSDSAWLHWRKKTYDGWYCIQNSDGRLRGLLPRTRKQRAEHSFYG